MFKEMSPAVVVNFIWNSKHWSQFVNIFIAFKIEKQRVIKVWLYTHVMDIFLIMQIKCLAHYYLARLKF